jgi:hypothetical protein
MELEPYHEAHQNKCSSKNDQKGSGVESHWATFFTARTMGPFKLFAYPLLAPSPSAIA